MFRKRIGSASMSIKQNLDDVFGDFFDFVSPNSRDVIEREFTRIETEAKKIWPKRQPDIRRSRETGRVTYYKDRSQDSWEKWRRGYRVDVAGNLVIFLENYAKYAWAIKYGEDPINARGRQIIRPLGKRVAIEAVFSPFRKGARKVVQEIADKTFDRR